MISRRSLYIFVLLKPWKFLNVFPRFPPLPYLLDEQLNSVFYFKMSLPLLLSNSRICSVQAMNTAEANFNIPKEELVKRPLSLYRCKPDARWWLVSSTSLNLPEKGLRDQWSLLKEEKEAASGNKRQFF